MSTPTIDHQLEIIVEWHRYEEVGAYITCLTENPENLEKKNYFLFDKLESAKGKTKWGFIVGLHDGKYKVEYVANKQYLLEKETLVIVVIVKEEKQNWSLSSLNPLSHFSRQNINHSEPISMAPSPLSNYGGNCYANSCLQLFLLFNIPWENGKSSLSKYFHRFSKARSSHEQRDLLNLFSVEFQKNVIRPGDIKEIMMFILDYLKRHDKDLLSHLVHNKMITNYCSKCNRKMNQKESQDNLFLFHLGGQHFDAEENAVSMRLAENPFRCCEVPERHFRIITFSKLPKYLLVFSETVKSFAQTINIPASNGYTGYTAKFDIVGYSRNTGGHCTAMVKRDDEWWHCDDQHISRSRLHPERKEAENHLVLIYKQSS